MDLRNLRYILEAAQQKNITKAAELLHMAQPTLSKIIKGMENELGVTLFDRSGKNVTLTDSGRAAIEQMKIIVNAVDDLYRKLEDISNLQTGIIKIGLPPVVSSVFFPRIAANFQKQYPNIEFQIVEEGAKRVEKLIMEGHIDLGVVVAPIDSDSFETVSLVEQQLALIIHKTHRLAGRDQVSIAELSAEPYIVFPKGFAVRELIMKACHTAGFEPKILYESSQWDLLAEMVAENLGITIMPEAVCRKITNNNVKMLSINNPVIPWQLVIIWKKGRYISHAMKQFMKLAILSYPDNDTPFSRGRELPLRQA